MHRAPEGSDVFLLRRLSVTGIGGPADAYHAYISRIFVTVPTRATVTMQAAGAQVDVYAVMGIISRLIFRAFADSASRKS